MSNLILQQPFVTGSTVTLTFKAGATPIKSFDITLDFDATVVSIPSVTATGPSGWAISSSPVGISSVLIEGDGITPLNPTDNAFSVSFNLLPGPGNVLYVGWSGTYNDPAVEVPPSAVTYLTGTANDDTLLGTDGNDAIQGLAGDDLIDGQGGDDSISGGEGLDVFAVGPGTARILDPQFGEYLYVPGAYFGDFEVVPGGGYNSNLQDLTEAGPLAGEVQWASAQGVTTLLIGLDSVAGADLTVYLKGSFLRDEIQAYQEYIDLNHLVAGALTINGTATQGQTLTLTDGLTDADGLGERQYQWMADLVDIPNATGSSLLLTQDLVGKTISVAADYHDANGMYELFVSTETSAVANVNDAPTGSVTLSGTPTQGQTLTAANTLADIDGIPGSGAGAITYQWKANGNAISGATSSTYVLTQADVGKTITVSASYTDNQGTPESVTSSATSAVANVNDAPTGSVTLSGTPTQGQTLTAANTLADIDGIPGGGAGAITYQWKANGNAISGATSSTYVLTQAEVGKTITVSASYTDNQGTPESVTSNATAAVANVNDTPTGNVTISGSPSRGQTLSAVSTLADIDGIPASGAGAIAYQWKADGTLIGGATNSTYILTSDELGKKISVTLSYTDEQGTPESVSSAETLAVSNNIVPTGSVTISGTPTQGQTLTAANTLADLDGIPSSGTGAITYQWKANGSDISGATSSTYVLTQAEVGKTITVTASYTDNQGTPESATSSATSAVVNINDAPTGGVSVSGTPTQGQTLSANTSTLVDLDGLGTLAYQWQADGIDIADATNSSLVLAQAQVGKAIRVVVSYTDALGTPETVTSSATSAVANTNDAPTGGVTISGTPTQGQTLTAANTLADIDGIPSSGTGAITYQWMVNGNAISGATSSTYVLTQNEVGKTITVSASYTDNQGTPESATSSATSAVANVNDAPTGSVTISGTPTQGQTLTAANTLADIDGIPSSGTGAITYQWRANGNAISGATSSTYVLTQNEVGKTVTVSASYTDNQGTPESATSSATTAVANVNDAPTGDVTLTGTATQYQTLTAANTLADIDGIPISGAGAITYQWKADGTPISGATSSTYVLTQAEVGKFITVTASYTDLQGTPESITSDPTATAVADVNDAPTGILYENPVFVLPEDSDVSAGVLVATIVAEDDTVGTNLAELSGGADESLFELREGGELWLKSAAGPLDFETKTSFNVRVRVYDPEFAGAPVFDDFRLLISNVVEAPVPEPTVVLELPPAESTDPNDSAAQQAYANWLLSVEAVAPPLDVPGAVQGDGNGDGLPDAEQASVGSRPFVISPTASTAPPTTEQTFVTLVAESTDGKSGSSAAAILENIRQDDAPADLPADISLPLGVIRFDAAVDQVGKTENFSLYVNAGLGITGYWKLNTEGVWVNLASAPYGGKMEVEGGRLRLDFQITDGGAFDNDGVANGVIADPGALGVVSLSLAGAVPDIPAGAVWF